MCVCARRACGILAVCNMRLSFAHPLRISHAYRTPGLYACDVITCSFSLHDVDRTFLFLVVLVIVTGKQRCGTKIRWWGWLIITIIINFSISSSAIGQAGPACRLSLKPHQLLIVLYLPSLHVRIAAPFHLFQATNARRRRFQQLSVLLRTTHSYHQSRRRGTVLPRRTW